MNENKLSPKECLDKLYHYLGCRGCRNIECAKGSDDRVDCSDWYETIKDKIYEQNILEIRLDLCSRVIKIINRKGVDFNFIRNTKSVREYNNASQLFDYVFKPLDVEEYRYLKYYVENVEGKYNEKF